MSIHGRGLHLHILNERALGYISAFAIVYELSIILLNNNKKAI